tara:strand:- start:45 stop:347 length:303 start_codon:yes stop_codon:yes gene_type:complete
MDKAQNLKDLEYSTNTELCIELLTKWKKKSNNPELNDFTNAFLNVIFYSTSLQQDRFINNKIVDEYRQDKIRAVIRARKSESITDDLKAEIKKLKSLTNL